MSNDNANIERALNAEAISRWDNEGGRVQAGPRHRARREMFGRSSHRCAGIHGSSSARDYRLSRLPVSCQVRVRSTISVPAFGVRIDESSHNSVGLLMRGHDGRNVVTVFVSRLVLDRWVESIERHRQHTGCLHAHYSTLIKRNLLRSLELLPGGIGSALLIGSIHSWTFC